MRLNELRKRSGASFGSESNADSSVAEVEGPRVENELDISVDNIRASMITTSPTEFGDGNG